MRFKTLLMAAMPITLGVAGTADAAVTTYSSAAAFNAATTGVTTTNFEGATSSTYILGSGSYTYPGSGFTITQTTNNAFLTDPSFTNYYYNWNTGDVINTPYSGTLTITFATPVTAFGIDLGNFYDDGLPGTPPGAPSTLYGLPISVATSQGTFTATTNTTRNFAFFGATSDTAFTSFSLSGLPVNGASTASNVIDNVRLGTALVAPVPEPASWAMMIGGFGLVGFAMRRRAKVRTSVAFG